MMKRLYSLFSLLSTQKEMRRAQSVLEGQILDHRQELEDIKDSLVELASNLNGLRARVEAIADGAKGEIDKLQKQLTVKEGSIVMVQGQVWEQEKDIAELRLQMKNSLVEHTVIRDSVASDQLSEGVARDTRKPRKKGSV